MKWKDKMRKQLEELSRSNDRLFARTEKIIHLLPATFINDLYLLREQINLIKKDIS